VENMKILKRFTLAAVVMLVLAAVAAPVYAACSSTVQINSREGTGVQTASYIWNPATFEALYSGAGYANVPPFAYTGPPVTADFTGFFWRLGYGDPTVGAGTDNGDYFAYRFNTYTGGNPNGLSWFSYYGIPGSFYYAGKVLANWANGGDGCMTDVALPQNPACECVLLMDQTGDEGYFAIVGGNTTAGGDLFIVQAGSDGNENAGPILLAPIPAPQIIDSARNETTFDITLQVTAPAPAGGSYLADGCACGPTGFQLYQQIVPRGSGTPASRDSADWTLMTLPGGVAQGVNSFGEPVTVESLCGASNSDVFLATKLVFVAGTVPGTGDPLFFPDASAAGVDYVSGDSLRIECGPQIAEPGDPRLEPTRKVRPDAPRTLRGTKRGR
jgi:hypothetical protein